ncbi:MAG: polysaccharide deacetylase family protein [Alphaproteobacteria bacterium]|nr:polysaccharide deacetylase family protein [Alphaproteobacteria bacterium]
MAIDLSVRGMALTLLGLRPIQKLLPPAVRGRGVIICLHSIGERQHGNGFAPMSGFRLRPSFLDGLLRSLRKASTPIVALRDVPAALSQPAGDPFVCFTFDDGYRDNWEIAWPIFRRWEAPFTVFLTTDFIDGTVPMCWSLLERCIASQDHFYLSDGERHWDWPTKAIEEKQACFAIVDELFRCSTRHVAQRLSADLRSRYGEDLWEAARLDALDWNNVREMAADPLVDIGAHSLSHPLLGQLDCVEALREIAGSKAVIEREIDRPVPHFAFPFGDDRAIGRDGVALACEAGFDVALTTRRDVLRASDVGRLHELPRITLDSRYETLAPVRAQLSGAPAAVKRLIRRRG